MKMQLDELVDLQAVDSHLDALGGAGIQPPTESGPASVKERQRLLAERRTIVAAVRPDLLRYYERLRKRHPQAIVGTSDGSCLGCFTRRPTSMASRPGGFETCERCGRILIRPD